MEDLAAGHRIEELWMGEAVLTLSDLIPSAPRAVCVGINPAPVSVQTGHYYQGRLGQRIFARLRAANLVADSPSGFEDDDAHEHGIGFTDIVKRPTARAADVRPEEYVHGRRQLQMTLSQCGAPLVIFTFKKAATAYFGPFSGGGFVDGLRIGDSEVFVLPGPMESSATADQKVSQLREWLARRG